MTSPISDFDVLCSQNHLAQRWIQSRRNAVVVPAQAGTQSAHTRRWIPAFAGMTASLARCGIVLLMICAASVLLTGCKADTAPSPGMGDPYPAPMNDPQISVLSPELRQWLVFQPAIVTKNGSQPMSVEVPVRNTTYNQYLIEYRILFYDANGRELTPTMGWDFASLDPKQVIRLKRSAMSTDADNYRLEVRWSR